MHGLISYFQAIVLGLVQGVAEPFPISSLGHSVILPRLAGWQIHQEDSYFISFLVATHLATAIVLFGFFFDDWRRILNGLWRSFRGRSDPTDTDARLGWLLLVGTIPAGLIGLVLQKPLQSLFASAVAAAGFLVLNGVGLLAFERLRTGSPDAGRSGLAGVAARSRSMPTRGRLAGSRPLPTRGRLAGSRPMPTRGWPGCRSARCCVSGSPRRRPSSRGYRGRARLWAAVSWPVSPTRRPPVSVPAGDPDHRSGGHPQAAGAARAGRRRDPRPGRGGRRLRRPDDLLRRQVPAPILRDQQPPAVRDLLHRRRSHVPRDLRGRRVAGRAAASGT